MPLLSSARPSTERKKSAPRLGLTLRARFALGVTITCAALVAMATPAWAHPYLLTSNPAVNSVVTTSPSFIDISYTEGLDLPYCKVVLVGPAGQQITTHVSHGSASNALTATLDGPLTQPGTYAVEWTAVGDDGHTVIGAYAISLDHTSSNSEVTAGAAPSSGSSNQPGLQWILRVILPGASIIMCALLFLGSVIAGEVARADAVRRLIIGRRFVRLRAVSAGVLGAVVVALALQSIASGGLSAFTASGLGRRLIVEAFAMLGVIPLLFDGRALHDGRAVSRLRQAWSVVVATVLLVVLATSSHALTQPASRRSLAVVVYVIHLGAVSLWIGALLAVTLPYLSGGGSIVEGVTRLRRLVAVAIVSVLVTGVLNSDWALRSVGQVVHTSYGGVVVAKLALYLGVVGLGVAGTLLIRRHRRQEAAGDVSVVATARRRSGRLFIAELSLAGVALFLAGVLGELPQPLDFPLASQEFATSVGLATSVAVSGPYTAVGVVSPGLVGSNQLIVRLARADQNQFLQPVAGVSEVRATVVCGCEDRSRVVTLHRESGGPWWSASVNLPKAATWSFATRFSVTAAGAKATDLRAALSMQVEPPSLPSQVVVGVAGDFSGGTGEQCQNETLGLQAALSDVNSQGVDDGNLVRLVAINVHDGVYSAMKRLSQLHPSVLALPCGTPGEVAAITDFATHHRVPVITESALKVSPGVWSLGPNWTQEGKAIADQVHTQGANEVTVIAGTTAVDREELSGFSAEAKRLDIDQHTSGLPANPATYVFGLALGGTDAITILANPSEASGVTAALSNLNLQTYWVPPRGILASAQLMNTDFINDAGQITRVGEMEMASTIDPFDDVDMYYAQRLRALTPGILPTFDGVNGYNAGLTISAALRAGGGHPGATDMAQLLASDFRHFSSGSFQATWGKNGGSASSVSFFRPTYVNPLALPANTAAGAQAMTHEGTFLDSGGFEQVAPFREMK
jgi:copper transport protein